MISFSKIHLIRMLLLAPLILLAGIPAAHCQSSDQSLYTDSLQNGWQDWGWATINYSNPSPVHSGSDSISVTAAAYGALYMEHADEDSTPYASLSFWINGGSTGGQNLTVYAIVGGSQQTAVPIGPLAANTWQQVTIGLDKLGAANNPSLDGFWISNNNAEAAPTFYVDDITLNAGTIVAPPNPAVTVSIDAAANRHAISPLIYGVAYGTADILSDLNCPVNRYGGNNASRYNWQLNADNRANDWYYESIGDSSAVPGERGDTFIANSKACGADAMLTIPMIPWIAKLGPNRSKLSSFSVAKYGAQQSTDSSWMPDAGNGVKADGSFVTGNDPNDANVPNSPDYEAGWISHLISQWGLASAGGLKYYILDNEPSIWHGTHRDVHPIGATMDEITNDIIAYAAKVKAADPSALTVAPEEWGWSGYFYSGYDQQYGSAHGWSSLPDRAAHGNMDYIPYMLQKLQQHDSASGQRLLDILSVHFYPQGGEYGNDVTPATELLRNRSTRQLWDPNYVSESWINDKVDLIPRLKGWVAQYYPGTQTAITEYNWGAEASINGATTQADIFGIFGREGLDLATRWTYPDPSTPTYKAMKMYRNYDGSKDCFGDTSVSDSVPNPDNLSSFAAIRSSDGALTIMVISKVLSGATPVTLNLANFNAASAAQTWQLTSPNAITQLASTPITGGALTATVPAQSITLFVVPPANTSNQPPTIATPAAANPGAVTGTSTNLTVLGADDKGESALTYTWAATGTPPAAVTFSANGTNAAKSTTATFTKAGDYNFTVTVTDADSATATSSVNVTVNATPTTLAVTPNTASVQIGATQQLSAAVNDQFGNPIAQPPSIVWSTTGGGTVNGGLFAASAAGGPFVATAACAAATGAANILVTSPAPPQSQILIPVADSYVQSGSNSGTNFGSSPTLVINGMASNSASGINQLAYLKFDLSQLTQAPKLAQLSHTATSAPSRSYRSQAIMVSAVPDADWTESGITWNNAPGLNPATSAPTGTTVAFQSFSMRQRNLLFDLTAFVAAHLGQVVTLQLNAAQANGHSIAFASKEASTGTPTLTLAY